MENEMLKELALKRKQEDEQNKLLQQNQEKIERLKKIHEKKELEKEKLIREGKLLPKEGKGLKLFKNAVEYFTK